MMISFECFSQRGTDKAHNEDALLLDGQVRQGSVREQGLADTSRPCCFAVADGVHIGVRPRTASRRLLELLQARLAVSESSAPLAPILHRVQQDYAALGDDPQFRGMASTLVGVHLAGNSVTVFNVGDSRAYLLADGQARLLSHDHSLLNDLLDDGEISPDQAESAASFMRGLTCQFVADREFDEFSVNIATHVWQPGERVLLCSDGLNEVLNDREIATLFFQDPDVDLRKVYRAARQGGGTDDFSVLVLARTDSQPSV